MKNNDHEERVYRIKSLDKALTILECFSYQKKEMTLSEMAEQVEMRDVATPMTATSEEPTRCGRFRRLSIVTAIIWFSVRMTIP